MTLALSKHALIIAAVMASAWPAIAQTPQLARTDFAKPLTGTRGDTQRGRTIVMDRRKGLCLLCHSGPFPEERFQGNIAPSLSGVGARMTEAEIRLRMVDSRLVVPETIMPPYHTQNNLVRVAPAFVQAPILTATEIEDVVAFLVTLED